MRIYLLVMIVSAVFAGIVGRVRFVQGKKRLAALEAGGLCISCDSLDVKRENDIVRCNTCGHGAPLSLMQGSVSAEELKALTKPDTERRY